MKSPLRLGLLPDYKEEEWPSMDLACEMLVTNIQLTRDFELKKIEPFYFQLTKTNNFLKGKKWYNIERLMNRQITYRLFLRSQLKKFNAFHLVDHSYSQMMLTLPNGKAGVLCHDLDTFRCILEPQKEMRPWWFRQMVKKTLDGFNRAAIVFFTTESVKREILRFGLVSPEKLVHAPNGVAEEFQPEAQEPIVKIPLKAPFLLHVGSCIPRKRIDLLVRIVGQFLDKKADWKLLQIGGEFTSEQLDLIQKHNLQSKIIQVKGVSRNFIAEAYRKSEVVLITSDAEGFGLPLIEALACGAKVVVSDIPVLREVGGDAANFCPVGEIDQWVSKIEEVCNGAGPALDVRLKQASKYTWENHARIIATAYQKLLS